MEVYAKQTQKKWRNMQNGHRKNREIRKQDGGNDEMVDTKDKQMGEHVNGNGDVNATGEYRDGGYKNQIIKRKKKVKDEKGTKYAVEMGEERG